MTPEQRYTSFDSRNEVCPRCCVSIALLKLLIGSLNVPYRSSDLAFCKTRRSHETCMSRIFMGRSCFSQYFCKGLLRIIGPLNPSSLTGCSWIRGIFKTPCTLFPETRWPLVDRSDRLGRPDFLSCLSWVPWIRLRQLLSELILKRFVRPFAI